MISAGLAITGAVIMMVGFIIGAAVVLLTIERNDY